MRSNVGQPILTHRYDNPAGVYTRTMCSCEEIGLHRTRLYDDLTNMTLNHSLNNLLSTRGLYLTRHGHFSHYAEEVYAAGLRQKVRSGQRRISQRREGILSDVSLVSTSNGVAHGLSARVTATCGVDCCVPEDLIFWTAHSYSDGRH
jgi:hypothetical protein